MDSKDIFLKHPDSLSSEKQVAGLFNDYFPREPKKRNTLTQAYQVGIISLMEDNSELTQALKNKITRMLNENYGTDSESADWAVQFWFEEYGEKVLHKRIQTVREAEKEAARQKKKQQEAERQKQAEEEKKLQEILRKEKLQIEAEAKERARIKAGEEAASKKKRNRVIIFFVAAALLIAAIFGYKYFSKPTIPFNEYIIVNYSGYDYIGTAEVSYDREKLFNDFGDSIKLNKNSALYEINKKRIESGERVTDLLIENLKGKLNRTDYLTNGDEISYSWDIDSELIKETFDIFVDYHDVSFTVKGLKAVEQYDPFSNLDISFSGTEPNGKAMISKKSKTGIDAEYSFSIDKNDNLSDGDTVTVTVLHNGNDKEFLKKCIETYNKKLTKTSNSYVVNNLNYFVRSASEIKESALREINKNVTADLESSASQLWPEELSLKKVEYVGNYYLNRKQKTAEGINHDFIAVYKVTADISIPKKDYSEEIAYYYLADFENLLNNPDGNSLSDLSKYNTSDHSFTYKTGVKKGFFSKYEFQFTGYKELEELYADYVEKKKNDFNIEDAISSNK